MLNRITTKQYSILLYEITRGLKKTENKEKISKFVKFLDKNNDLNLANRIIKEFKSYTMEQEGEREVELLSAKPIDNEIHQQLIDILSKKGKVELKKKIDPGLLGGMIIRIGDTMIDNSIRRKLNILSDKLK